MSNREQDTLIKEANELLETAQKEVLKEINKKKNLFARIFSEDSSDALKNAQSSITKAINQMKNFNRDESSMVKKLQNHLNEKNQEIKKIEDNFEQNSKTAQELKDKIRQYQAKIEELESTRIDESAANQDLEIKETAKDHKIEDDLKAKIQSIEEANREIENRYRLSQEDLSNSQELAVEFSKRIKKLKAEITNG